MALNSLKFAKLAKQCSPLRLFHKSCNANFFDILKKPFPRIEDSAVGYQRIAAEAAEAGEDPFEADRETPSILCGSGTRRDPYRIPSRNKKRFVLVCPPNHDQVGGPVEGFWVTCEDGGRCPITAQYYRIQHEPDDKWGIDELDLFKH